MNFLPIINQAKDFVIKFIKEHPNKKIIYHTLSHTETIVELARQISIDYEQSNNDLIPAVIAAWFVDTGYYEDYREHEESSARIAEDFLRKVGAEDEKIKEVKNCLLATKMPQKPASISQRIVCDAVLFHLAADDFGDHNKLMRKELSLLQGIPVDKKTWRKNTIQFMEGHTYFTDFAKRHLAKRKKENLQKLKKKELAAATPVDPVTALLQSRPGPTLMPDANTEKQKENPERTIETMFRITADKNQRLSDQADAKSNILISVNVISISVLLTVLTRSGYNISFTIPLLTLLMVSLLTIIFSILATRPFAPAGIFTMNELKEKKVNLLFFGNFYNMNFEEYYTGMLQVMDDRKFLYLSLLRDSYTQGVRLGQKYKMLKTAYNIFMYGLILAIVVFVIAYIISVSTNSPTTIDY